MINPHALTAQLRAIATQIEGACKLLRAVDNRDDIPGWPTTPARVELLSAAKRARKMADKTDPKRRNRH